MLTSSNLIHLDPQEEWELLLPCEITPKIELRNAIRQKIPQTVVAITAEKSIELFKHYKKASEQKNHPTLATAYSLLAWCYVYGVGTEISWQQARCAYGIAAELGSMVAKNNLGVIAALGKTSWKEKLAIMDYFKQLTETRSPLPSALYNLAKLYERKFGIKNPDTKELEIPRTLLKAAAEKGHSQAQFFVANSWVNRASQNWEKAENLWRQSAEQGNINGIFALGQLYRQGLGSVKSDAKRAQKYYNQADAQDPFGSIAFEIFYYASDVWVTTWLEKALAKNNVDAQLHMASLYIQGKQKLPQDAKKAFELYQKAASQGNYKAMTQVGLCYKEGCGVTQDNSAAQFWFKQVAELNLKKHDGFIKLDYREEEDPFIDLMPYYQDVIWKLESDYLSDLDLAQRRGYDALNAFPPIRLQEFIGKWQVLPDSVISASLPRFRLSLTNGVTPNFYNALSQHKTLMSLQLGGDAKIDDEKAKLLSSWLANNTTLTALSCQMESPSAAIIMLNSLHHSHLQSLHLSHHWQVEGEAIPALSNMLAKNTEIKALGIGGRTLCGWWPRTELFSVLANHPSITELHLHNPKEDYGSKDYCYPEFFLAKLKENNVLKKLSLTFWGGYNKNPVILSQFPATTLQELEVTQAHIEDVSSFLDKHPMLQSLKFNHRSECKACKCDEKVVKLIERKSNLHTLHLNHVDPEPSSIPTLVQALSRHPTMTSLGWGYMREPRIADACKKNEEQQIRLQINWGIVSVMIAFARANSNQPFLIGSLLPLLPQILYQFDERVDSTPLIGRLFYGPGGV